MAKRQSTEQSPPGEQAALLTTIIRDWDDDTPRLVYADWLQENGQPERAEFIRLQCRIARARPGDANDERAEWEDRESELLDRHGNEWAADFLGRGVRSLQFRRGFVEEVHATANAFLGRGEVWTRQTPLRKVALNDVSVRASDLAASPAVHSIAELEINDPRFDDAALAALVSRPGRSVVAFYPRLEALRITARFRIGTAGLAAFARCGGMPSLRSLSVRHTRVGDRGAAALVAAGGFAALTSIDLFQGEIGDEGLVALTSLSRRASSFGLELGYGRITADALAPLAALPSHSGFRYMVLDGNPISAIDPDQVGAVLDTFPNLWLRLWCCPIPEPVKEELQRRFHDRVLVTRIVPTRNRRIKS